MLMMAACHSQDNARGMTSFSSRANSATTPRLFTIPANQMSHVQVLTINPATMTHTLRLTGTVAYNAFKTTPVISQIGGPVSKIMAVPGDRVKINQPMLDVSSPDYAQLLDGYLKAADSFRLASILYKRNQDLYAHQAIAKQDLEQAESNRTQAQADLNAAEQGMRILGIKSPQDLAKAPSSAQIEVLAPISGEVVERMVSPGQVLQAGQTQAFTISDLSTVWVLANVYQSDLEYVKQGDDVLVQTDAFPQTFHGKISYVSPALDPNTRTLQARIVVDNPGERLKRDMYCTVTVTAGVLKNVLSVPIAAMMHDENNEPYIYVLTGENQFSRRDVQLGETQGTELQITKGLAPGEKVVGNGSLFLQFANSFQH